MIQDFFTTTEVTKNVRLASTKQMDYLEILVKQCNEELKSSYTPAEASSEIARLREKIGNTASQAQIKYIETLMLQGNYPMDSLIMKYGQTNVWTKQLASSIVEKLKARIKSDSDEKLATDAQVDMLLKMFYCPDVDYENYLGIQIWTNVMYEGRAMRRRTTPEEFKEAVKQIKSSEINEFIQKFKAPYLKWMQGQATTQQRELIRTLEERLSNLHKPRFVETTTDMYGNKNEIVSQKDIPWTGYKKMDEYALYQMTQALASKYIDQLTIEVADKTLGASGITDEEKKNTEYFDAEVDVDREDKNDVFNKTLIRLSVLADVEIEKERADMEYLIGLINYINVNNLATNAQIISAIEEYDELLNVIFS